MVLINLVFLKVKEYINKEKSKTFSRKSKGTQKLINTTLFILDQFGIPMTGTQRRLERMAIAFLACGDVKTIKELKSIKDSNSGHALGTRQIIDFVNDHFNESQSKGSYDDIRRKDLLLLTTADIVLQSQPGSNQNDSTRGYNVNPFYANIIRNFGSKNWMQKTASLLKGIEPLSERIKRKRNLHKLEVKLPSGKKLQFGLGEHNQLQKLIIEEFLPIYGYESEVLYVGDALKKYLHRDEKKLEELNFFEIAHDKLPDIVAYSKAKNWIYLIEAVHTSNPIDEIRLITLKKMTKKCTADIVYVTAFLDRPTFKKFMVEIAWETEVWIADNPEHMIHFNGDKFLGPYDE